jgi:hypothetical protein
MTITSKQVVEINQNDSKNGKIYLDPKRNNMKYNSIQFLGQCYHK